MSFVPNILACQLKEKRKEKLKNYKMVGPRGPVSYQILFSEFYF